MDPSHFVRILVGNLAIKSNASSKPSSSAKVHPSSSSFFCHIHLKPKPNNNNSPPRRHIATVPLISPDTPPPHSLAACFDFTKPQILNHCLYLKISVYKNRTTSSSSCAFGQPKFLGKITVPLDLSLPESRACMFHNGWVALGGNNTSNQLLHLTVRAEPDPRFVFRFDGEPECSPQVFQVKGDVKQPVFTCKFSFRDKTQAQAHFQPSVNLAERKGWSITIHDLSGSAVAAASMVTPFVPSPGSQRVSRSNPGAWLIIRPDGDGTWKPWGRLEAWRESNAVGYRFEVADRVTVAGSTIDSQHGGKLTIDVTSPGGSRDLGFEQQMYKGFVMSAKVEGEGKRGKAEVEVEIGVQHVTCTEDAAAFVALAAAMDLSMDACKLFSQKLRKELRQRQ
ncbi:hypothetical protein RIF29_37701 [Crotalaria pallida]|uniref:Formin-like protein 18 n=1 Tax=Crotalaria pallida TaxID=3830 RepID=A0AAN9EEN0_CROPI